MSLPSALEDALRHKRPCLWINERWEPASRARESSRLSLQDVHDAAARLDRFAPLLTQLFPELKSAGGRVESPLLSVEELHTAILGKHRCGRWFIKADHALPVAGSIKARGGLYEVLVHAETLALREGLIQPQEEPSKLASPQARELFARHEVVAGSTGNLGLSIGIMAAALGFRAIIHMSADAKPWKKARLRAHGVEVIEHDGNFVAAVAAGREQSRQRPNSYFVDDEHSERLFLGYSVAALRLQQQLAQLDIAVDAQHPLFVYLPCGVGGAPGGITFGLRHLFGDAVHCFFAEPVAAPSMLLRLASTQDSPISIAQVGLDGRTEADGLAVAAASELVAPLIRPLVSGIFTVPDEHLFEDLYLLEQTQGLRIEPSAAAGFRGPLRLQRTEAGREYLSRHGLLEHLPHATHILWTTGGALVPEEEYARFHERGRSALARC